MDESTLLVVGAITLLALLLSGMVLALGTRWSVRHCAMLLTTLLAVFCIAVFEWLWLGETIAVSVFQAAVAAVASGVLFVSGHRLGWRAVALVVPWGSLVLAPVSYSVFDVERGYLSVTVGALDFAGGLTLAVCTGGAALVLAVIRRRRGQLTTVDENGSRWRFVVIPILAVAGLVVVQVASELDLDATTARVLHVEALAAAGGFIGWVGTMIATSRASALLSTTIGALAGVVAVLPFAPWLDDVAAVVLGVGAGILGQLTRARALRAGLAQLSVLPGVLLVPGLLGVGAAGIIANPPGLIYSGHTDLLVAQLIAIAVSLGWSCAVTLALAVVLVRRQQPAAKA
jgi:ammonium transporter, Amt family